MCWKCGAPIDDSQKIYRDSVCPKCGANLHCCKGCSFYSVGSHYDCHETIEEPVSDKEGQNFCDYFKASKKSFGTNDDSSKKARDAFNSLFG